MPNTTADNTIVKLRLATFVAIIVAVVTITFSASGFYFNTVAVNERIDSLDERISKTTGRNAEDIKRLEDHLYDEINKKNKSE